MSLTTYYFKDIEELIHHAIWLNAEISILASDSLWLNLSPLITEFDKAALRKSEIKRVLAENISQTLFEHIISTVSDKYEEISVEQILFTQTHLSDDLKRFSDNHKAILLEPFLKLCRALNKKSADIDAEILFTLIKQWQYQFLAINIEEQDKTHLYSLIFRTVSLLLKVK